MLDTSALVALERLGRDWSAAMGELADEAVALPAVVYAELLVGVLLADSARRAGQRRARDVAIARIAP